MLEHGLFYHEEETKIALRKLEVSSEILPSELPQINEIIWPRESLRIDENLSIVGLNGPPSAGKTTVFTRSYNEMADKIQIPVSVTGTPTPWIYHLGRYASKFKNNLQGDPTIRYSFFEQHMWQLYALKSEYETYAEVCAGKEMSTPILVERNELDILVFSRANYLHGGRLHRFSQDIIEYTVEEIMQPDWPRLKPFYKAYIFCLIPPKESLDRDEEQENPSRTVLTLPFLNTLYEQYLRIHLQAISGDIPHPYACLDFTKTPDENYRLLTDTLNTMHDYFSKV